MEIVAARDFVRDNQNAVLMTYRTDGSPQMSPVTVGVDPAGNVVISSRETAFKVRNLRRDPRAYLCVLPDTFIGAWVWVAGSATIQSLPEAMDGLVEYYRSLSGEHPDWDDYRRAMIRDERCLIRVEIERAGPDRSG
jgi:PPOX class probable F420-dependent enzyme